MISCITIQGVQLIDTQNNIRMLDHFVTTVNTKNNP